MKSKGQKAADKRYVRILSGLYRGNVQDGPNPRGSNCATGGRRNANSWSAWTPHAPKTGLIASIA